MKEERKKETTVQRHIKPLAQNRSLLKQSHPSPAISGQLATVVSLDGPS